MQIQNRSRDAGPGGEFGFVEIGGGGLRSDGEQFVGGGRVGLVLVEVRLQQTFEHFGFGRFDVARDGSTEGEVQTIARS